MIEQEQTIIETEWGMHVVIKEGVTLTDDAVSSRVKLIVEKCKEAGKKRILIDETGATRNVSFMKLFEGVTLMQNLGAIGFKFAFIAPHLVDNSDSRFMETIGANRAVYIKFFHDQDTALEWLLK